MFGERMFKSALKHWSMLLIQFSLDCDIRFEAEKQLSLHYWLYVVSCTCLAVQCWL